MAEECCQAFGGAFTPGGVCDPIGACCYDGDGNTTPETCLEMAEDCCAVIGGVYHGDGSTCTGTQACCYPNGDCEMLDPWCCGDLGGTPWGAGTTCDPNPCPSTTEACCMPDGSCTDADPADCLAAGGIPQGPGSSCGAVICQACCLEDASCIVTGHTDCVHRDGDPQGPGVICAGYACHPLKWSQPPLLNPDSPAPHCFWGWDAQSLYEIGPIAVDDWLCETEQPVTNIHWWGSYFDGVTNEGWAGPDPPPEAPDAFHIAIWTDVQEPPPGFSHPGFVLQDWVVPRMELMERPVGCDFYPGMMTGIETCFRYDFFIPDGQEFDQGPVSSIFWVSISALYLEWPEAWVWGWKTREYTWGDDAVWTYVPLMPVQGMPWMEGYPIMGGGWDLTFVLTTVPPGEIGDPQPAPYPHNRKKNRYISFDPNKAENDGNDIAFKVELKSLWLGSCSGSGVPCRLDKNECSGSGTPCHSDADCLGGETCISPDCGTCMMTPEPCNNYGWNCSLPGDICIMPDGEICMNDQAGSVGRTWWVGPENAATGVHLMVTQPCRKVSTNWPAVVHVGDCEIAPVATYGVRAVNVTAIAESAELEVSTIDKPNTYWADGVGPLGNYCTGNWAACTGPVDCPGESCIEQWPPPDGFTNFNDVTAAVFKFQMLPGFTVPHMTWVDMYGAATGDPKVDPPDYVVNFSDIQQIVLGFQGWPYLFADPAECPDVCPR